MRRAAALPLAALAALTALMSCAAPELPYYSGRGLQLAITDARPVPEGAQLVVLVANTSPFPLCLTVHQQRAPGDRPPRLDPDDLSSLIEIVARAPDGALLPWRRGTRPVTPAWSVTSGERQQGLRLAPGFRFAALATFRPAQSGYDLPPGRPYALEAWLTGGNPLHGRWLSVDDCVGGDPQRLVLRSAPAGPF